MNTALGLSLLCLLSSGPSVSVNIVNLSSNSFRCREQAAAVLAIQMPRVRLQLTVAAAWSPCAETRSRSDRILREWRPSLRYQIGWWCAVWPRRWPHFDMIDSLHRFPAIALPECGVPDCFGHPGRDTLFLAYFNQPACDIFGPDFWGFRTASARYCGDLMRAGHQPEGVRPWLAEMAALEEEWYRTNRMERP